MVMSGAGAAAVAEPSEPRCLAQQAQWTQLLHARGTQRTVGRGGAGEGSSETVVERLRDTTSCRVSVEDCGGAELLRIVEAMNWLVACRDLLG